MQGNECTHCPFLGRWGKSLFGVRVARGESSVSKSTLKTASHFSEHSLRGVNSANEWRNMYAVFKDDLRAQALRFYSFSSRRTIPFCFLFWEKGSTPQIRWYNAYCITYFVYVFRSIKTCSRPMTDISTQWISSGGSYGVPTLCGCCRDSLKTPCVIRIVTQSLARVWGLSAALTWRSLCYVGVRYVIQLCKSLNH